AIRTFLLTATALSVSVAPFALLNDTAAVLVVPTTSASMPMSRVKLVRAVVVSYATRARHASRSAVLVTPMMTAMTLRASDRSRPYSRAQGTSVVIDAANRSPRVQ